MCAVGGILLGVLTKVFLNRSWFVPSNHLVFQGLQFVFIDLESWLSRIGMISQQCWFIQVDEESWNVRRMKILSQKMMKMDLIALDIQTPA